MSINKRNLSPKQREQLFITLKTRFDKNMNRHKALQWTELQAKMEADPDKLWSVQEMERTGRRKGIIIVAR
jgi:hypothetical protein